MSSQNIGHPCVIVYHRVATPQIDTHLLAVRPENFDAQLAWLIRNREVVSLYTLLQDAARGYLPSRRAAITFDDGYADNLTQALPLLEKYQVPATVFVSSGYIDKAAFWVDLLEDALLGGHCLPSSATFMGKEWTFSSNQERQQNHDAIHALLRDNYCDSDILKHVGEFLGILDLPESTGTANPPLTALELQKLAATPLIEIGAHCVGHPKLSILDAKEQRREIEESCDTLNALTGKPVRLFAYPYGSADSYNEITRAILKEKSLYGIANIQDDLSLPLRHYDIPRRLVRNWPAEEFAAWMQSAPEAKHIFEGRALADRASRGKTGSFMPPAKNLSGLSSLHINTLYGHGGAAKVAERLVSGLKTAGTSSRLLVGKKLRDSPDVSEFDVNNDHTLEAYCQRKGHLFYSFRGSHELWKHPDVQKADIVHLHNLHGGYFNPWSLSGLSFHRPVVWTLHDMQSFTGHCAHSFECKRWQAGCGTCPHLETEPALSCDSTARLWQDKKLIYENSALWIVSPSQWLADKASKSILGGHPITCIPNAIDTHVFSPRDKREARRRLGIAENSLVLGGVADGGMLENKWKGGAYTLKAVKALSEQYPNLLYLNIGGGNSSDAALPHIRTLSHINDEESLAWAYSAMDIFLYPSLADNCPMTVIEALSCGIPVVAFATGGIPELVRDGASGMIIPAKETNGLVKAVDKLILDKTLREKMAYDARQDAEKRFSMDLFIKRHQALYQNARQTHETKRTTCRRFNARKLPWITFSPEFVSLEESKPEPSLWNNADSVPKNCLRYLLRKGMPKVMSGLFPTGHALEAIKNRLRSKYGEWKTAGGYTGRSRILGSFFAGKYVTKRIGQKIAVRSPLVWRKQEFLRTEPVSRIFGFDRGTPIDRYYIEKFLAENSTAIKGHVLEIASDTYTRRFGSGVEKVSIVNAIPSPTATIVGDLATGENIPQKTFDCVILTQTIHVIYDVKSVLSNAYSSLTPGGILLVTTPGISQISSYDMQRWGDYWRFTDKSLTMLINECCPDAEQQVAAYGNLAVAKAFLDGRTIEEVPRTILDLEDQTYQLLLTAMVRKPESSTN